MAEASPQFFVTSVIEMAEPLETHRR